MSQNTKVNFVRLTKVQLEEKIQLMEQELSAYKFALAHGNYFDYEKCKRCGGQGWYFSGLGIENTVCQKCKKQSSIQ